MCENSRGRELEAIAEVEELDDLVGAVEVGADLDDGRIVLHVDVAGCHLVSGVLAHPVSE